jgi:hypothetical protein
VGILERFWPKVEKGNACWIWKGSRDAAGYGHIGFEKRVEKAHRISWMLAHGKIPGGMDICHTCDNPSCVNPDHLFLGTRSENILDSVAKGRWHNPDNSGSKNGQSKLNEEQVAEIRASFVRINGVTSNALALAEKFRVSRATIWDIIAGRRWKTSMEA